MAKFDTTGYKNVHNLTLIIIIPSNFTFRFKWIPKISLIWKTISFGKLLEFSAKFFLKLIIWPYGLLICPNWWFSEYFKIFLFFYFTPLFQIWRYSLSKPNIFVSSCLKLCLTLGHGHLWKTASWCRKYWLKTKHVERQAQIMFLLWWKLYDPLVFTFFFYLTWRLLNSDPVNYYN